MSFDPAPAVYLCLKCGPRRPGRLDPIAMTIDHGRAPSPREVHVNVRRAGVAMTEPVLNFRRGSAALREMRPATVFQAVHVSLFPRNPGETTIRFHELIEPNPRDPERPTFFVEISLSRRKKRPRIGSALFQPGPESPELLNTERMFSSDRAFSAVDLQNPVSFPKVGSLEEPDLMSAEPAMISDSKNRSIALRFDDRKERPYLLYFQVLIGLFARRFRAFRGLYTLRTLTNSPRKRLFFAHVFYMYGLFVHEYCITHK